MTTHVEAPPARVFGALVDWESQPTWRRDARRVVVRGDERRGVGTHLLLRTELLPGVIIDDHVVVTGWEEERLVAVRHSGRVVRGVGAVELAPTPHGTRVEWWQEVDLPLWAVGEALATLLVVPWATRTARASLAGLKRVCESRSVRP